jgi:hypothetical protein
MGKSFPDSRDTILRSKNPGDVTALAVKIARNRPEVYLLFHSGKGEFDIFDEALFDAYSNDMYIKPDWKVFWPLI